MEAERSHHLHVSLETRELPLRLAEAGNLHRNELSGTLRDDCLRQERNAGAGATRPGEPATAPPPQNPR